MEFGKKYVQCLFPAQIILKSPCCALFLSTSHPGFVIVIQSSKI